MPFSLCSSGSFPRLIPDRSQGPTGPILAMEETVGFGAVDYFAGQRVVLNGVPDEKGGIAEENNLRHRAADVKAGERLRAALAGDDPFSVVPASVAKTVAALESLQTAFAAGEQTGCSRGNPRR